MLSAIYKAPAVHMLWAQGRNFSYLSRSSINQNSNSILRGQLGRFSRAFQQSSAKLKSVPPKPKRGSDRSDMMKLVRLAKPEWKTISAAIGLLVISSSVTMAVPYAVGKVIDIITSNAGKDELKATLNKVCKVLGVIFLIGAAANFGRIYFLQTSGQRIVRTLRKDVYASIIQQELAFFDQSKTGELVNRLSTDTTLVAESLTQNLSDGLRSTVMAITGASMMFYVSPKLACVGLVIVPIVGGVVLPFSRKLKSKVKDMQTTLASTTQIAQERISNMRTVKAFSQEGLERAVYDKGIGHVLKQSYDLSWMQARFFGLNGLIGNSLVITVLYTGGILMTDGAITVGQLSSFLLYVVMVATSVNGLSTFYTTLMKGVGASSRLFELAERKPLIPLDTGLIPKEPLKGDIMMKNIQFTYPARPEAPIFNGLDLHIPGGSISAIVGSSGSGKSSVSSLLLRLYDIDGGEISVDGHEIRTLQPKWLREQIGLVAQEPVLFNASIFENITYGAVKPSEVTWEAVVTAAQQANALSFIETFPDGFNTLVGERGVMLSGGQKQRVAIARAILRNPKILILDEATSALDAESEFLVQDALDKLLVGRTVIVIAHRLSTIRNADTINVLSDGKVVEKGSYAELLQIQDGVFRNLVEKQTFA